MQVNRKVAAGVIGTGAVAVAGAGIAFAAWSSTGAGSGAGASTTSSNSTITAVTPVTADDLYPGAVKNSYVTINNPNDYPVLVTSISAGYSALTSGGCAATSVRTDAVALDATGLAQTGTATKTIAPHGTGKYTLVLRMSNAAADNCKSQSFTLGGDSTDGTGDMTATLVSNASTTGNGF